MCAICVCAIVLLVGVRARIAASAASAEPGADLRVLLLGIAVEVRQGYVRVSEVVHLRNGGARAFEGALTFPLPPQARFIVFHEGLERPSVDGDRIIDRRRIEPGASLQTAYSYTVAGAGTIALDRRLPMPVDRVEVFVDAPAHVRSPRLQSAPGITREGRAYTRASGHGVPAGALSLTVAGVPAVQRWRAPAAAGALAGLLAMGLVWATIVAGRRRASGAHRTLPPP
jgi:hypothetical protein